MLQGTFLLRHYYFQCYPLPFDAYDSHDDDDFNVCLWLLSSGLRWSGRWLCAVHNDDDGRRATTMMKVMAGLWPTL